ncbi:hypothetical protein FJSC11DRAFT_1268 [Fischerella thermalis JSC-11]|uniref:Uncharacterized protein n=1 Tax=Fischerella thermalis JSC-11 TaxID=741277 RepID=G6FQX1_9CYAN|nr:hypothetical protein [Fischerella thermalis]EHC18206.1 hypothetical protein FJSC11DRAFT_1268 [Fischerella thermalis JSC-11]
MIDIIPESKKEILAIRQLITEAFEQAKVAELVDIIRKSENFFFTFFNLCCCVVERMQQIIAKT